MQAEINYEEIIIWGGGLIGCTLATTFSNVDISSIIIDVDSQRVDDISNGNLKFIPSSDDPHDSFTKNIKAALFWKKSILPEQHNIHFLCIPTEKNGETDSNILSIVIDNLCELYNSNHELCLIIESTISPDWVNQIVHKKFKEHGLINGKHYHVCCSPRRDWFIEQNWTLTNMPKIIGSDSKKGVTIAKNIYGHVCENIEVAIDAKHAALTKVIENFYRFNNILLANQLSHMLPNYNITETLKLASTKWNMNLYHPSLGIGGYCVPLSKDYLEKSMDLTNLKSVYFDYIFQTESILDDNIKDIIIDFCKGKKVGLLGLAYAPELKIHSLSPTFNLVKILKSENIDVKVHDPLYKTNEILEIIGTESFNFPNNLGEFEVIILVAGHEMYVDIPDPKLFSYISNDSIIIDNLGAWSKRKFPVQNNYIEVGSSKFFGNKKQQMP